MTSQKLKIATWNLDRPTLATKAKNDSIVNTLHEIDADILVLTETNSCIDLSGKYTSSFASTCLFQSLSLGAEQYHQGENRVTIWSKLPGMRRIDMCNSHSAVCAQLTTDWGELNVYGTVIGIYGKHRGANEPILSGTDFERTLEVQLADWERLAGLGSLCVVGDFNLSLADSYYVTKQHRLRLLNWFRGRGIAVPTQEIPKNIDHIALSERFFNLAGYETETWMRNESDHMGVCLTIKQPPERSDRKA